MKPDFESMSKVELKAYVLAHREDEEALRNLFSRRSPDSEAMLFQPPTTEVEWQQQMELIRPILERDIEKERERQNKEQI